jgi:crotonobetainyl-CoA:carnitine CoA-transferase CaiB-like acyl-CoA transferase
MEMSYPLEGIRVLGLEQYVAGPDCTLWLANAGAEVIKIERPGVGEARRNYPPVVEDSNGNKAFGGFMIYNRCKKSLTLDLQSEKGREVYKELIGHADVVVENLAPGSVDRLGIGYDALQKINPRLIYAAMSGFGRLEELKGIYSNRPAFDPVIQAMSGITDQIGSEGAPPPYGFPGLADLYSGTVTAYSIMLALFMREKTGEGQFIDSCMYDNLVALNAMGIMTYSLTGQVLTRGRSLTFQAPAGVYKVKDGTYVALLVANELLWPKFCKAIEREDLIKNPKTVTGSERFKNKEFLEPIVQEWMAARTKDEVVDILLKNGVPTGPVQSVEDLVKCPHLKARKMLVEVEDPVAGKRIFARNPIRMSKAKEVPPVPAPRLGEHTDSILKELLNYDEERIQDLRKGKVV